MSRQIGKLSAISLPRIKKPGLHSDGGGLYLRVTTTEGRYWAFRYMLHGRAREMGLGALHALSLADARQKAADCRKLLSSDIDPISARNAERSKKQLEVARAQTFKQCAAAYIDSHKAGWRNEKHAAQWETSLDTYAYPVIGNLSVQDVDVALVMKVLEPIWKTKTETANRVRNRIENILDWATAREYRRGENPARWRGHLENLLPKRSKVQRVNHHPALPYGEVGDFIVSLKGQTGIGIEAFEFLILTAARSGEATGARWSEIDMGAKVWTIPANRIKAGRDHRVPLSESALKILKALPSPLRQDEFVFPGRNRNKSLSKMGLLTLLKHMKRTDITVHGFRSTFRDWCAEQTAFPREVAETALAHVSGDKVELAYRRSDLFDKRRQLMDAWARYCSMPSTQQSGKVTKLAGRR